MSETFKKQDRNIGYGRNHQIYNTSGELVK